MREEARPSARVDMIFENGADSFFHKGTNGRWRDMLTEEDSRRYEEMCYERLGEECANWLLTGDLQE